MTVSCAVSDGTATITLRRPDKLNMLTAEMVHAVLGHIEAAEHDDDVKAVVLRGEGRAFCGGFDLTDIRDFEGSPDEPIRARVGAVAAKADWMKRIFHARKPTIAEVKGPCTGIGTYLVLVADFAIAADDAALGFPEERLGSAGAVWAYPFLVATVGLKRATEMMLTGRKVGPEEAREMGLVNRVVPRASLEDEVAELASVLCSLPRDGIALNRVARELAIGQAGLDAAFEVHAALHPQAERLHRSPDEFDFAQVAADKGLREALAERDRRFDGSWWGWGSGSGGRG